MHRRSPHLENSIENFRYIGAFLLLFSSVGELFLYGGGGGGLFASFFLFYEGFYWPYFFGPYLRPFLSLPRPPIRKFRIGMYLWLVNVFTIDRICSTLVITIYIANTVCVHMCIFVEPRSQWRSEGNWRPGTNLNFAPPPSKKILKNKTKMSSIQLIMCKIISA